MALQAKKVDVWAGEVRDVPGGLADVLGSLAGTGANLEFVIARRDPSRPGMGQIFLTPVNGKRAQAAAQSGGLSRSRDMGTLRIEGADRPGTGERITRAIADAGINVRGVSTAVVGNKFVAYFGFDSVSDAEAAARALRGADAGEGRTASRAKATGRKRTARGRSKARAR